MTKIITNQIITSTHPTDGIFLDTARNASRIRWITPSSSVIFGGCARDDRRQTTDDRRQTHRAFRHAYLSSFAQLCVANFREVRVQPE